MKHLSEAYNLSSESGDRFGEASPLASEGNVYFAEGNLILATDRYRSAIKIADLLGAIQYQASTRVNLAWTYLGLNEVPGALELAQKATCLEFPPKKAEAYLALGAACLRRDDRVRARDALSLALTVSGEMLDQYAKSRDSFEVKTLALCALTVCENGAYLDAAQDSLQAYRAMNPPPGAVKFFLRRFDTLAPADKAGLLPPLRAILADAPNQTLGAAT